jgi:hypothetical protein
MYAVSNHDGTSFSAPSALASRAGVYQLQPSLALGADGTVGVAWNEIDQDGKHVVFVRLPRPDRGR